MIKIIAAVGKNLELGKNGTLIWNLPNDLKFFKEQTLGCPVLMGCNTFNSLPRKLPGRKHIVLAFKTDKFKHDITDIDIVYSEKEAMDLAREIGSNQDIFIIGGASVYKMFVEAADELILTEVDMECKDADVYFPNFDKSNYVRRVIGQNSDEEINYTHVIYAKKN